MLMVDEEDDDGVNSDDNAQCNYDDEGHMR